jgi:hypothetical protein
MSNAGDGIEQSLHSVASNRSEPEVAAHGSTHYMDRPSTVHALLA